MKYLLTLCLLLITTAGYSNPILSQCEQLQSRAHSLYFAQEVRSLCSQNILFSHDNVRDACKSLALGLPQDAIEHLIRAHGYLRFATRDRCKNHSYIKALRDDVRLFYKSL